MVQSLAKYYRSGRIVENLILEGGEIAYWKINCADAQMLAVASFIALDQVHLGGILATSELAVGLIRSSPQFPFVPPWRRTVSRQGCRVGNSHGIGCAT
jgi:hypothetical protein